MTEANVLDGQCWACLGIIRRASSRSWKEYCGQEERNMPMALQDLQARTHQVDDLVLHASWCSGARDHRLVFYSFSTTILTVVPMQVTIFSVIICQVSFVPMQIAATTMYFSQGLRSHLLRGPRMLLMTSISLSLS